MNISVLTSICMLAFMIIHCVKMIRNTHFRRESVKYLIANIACFLIALLGFVFDEYLSWKRGAYAEYDSVTDGILPCVLLFLNTIPLMIAAGWFDVQHSDGVYIPDESHMNKSWDEDENENSIEIWHNSSKCQYVKRTYFHKKQFEIFLPGEKKKTILISLSMMFKSWR